MHMCMQVCAEKLQAALAGVEGFVRYLEDVAEVTAAIAPLDRRLVKVTNLYNVAQEFDVPVAEEEMALYRSLFPLFRNLKVQWWSLCVLCRRYYSYHLIL